MRKALCPGFALVVLSFVLCSAQAASAGVGFLKPVGDQFVLDGATYKIKGANYYPASAPWGAWFGNWNWSEITADIDRMRGLGVNAMRINLPYTAGGWGGASVNPVYLNRLERLVEYLRYRGMKADVTLFDWETSFPAAGTQTEADHKKYVTTIVTRLKDNPGVFVWDVKNEPDHPSNIGGGDDWDGSSSRDKIVSWLSRMCQTVRSVDTNHCVSAGIRWWENVDEVLSFEDVAIFHSYWGNIGTEEIPDVKGFMGSSPKPILVEEFGWPSQPHPCWRDTYWEYSFTEPDQLNFYRTHLQAFSQHNIAGCVMWQALDMKGYVSDPNSDTSASFEDYFGLWRMGGTLKPAGAYYRDNWPAQPFPYSDDTVPAPVSGAAATGLDRAVTLTWTHSASPDCAGAMVRCSTVGYPASVTDGFEVASIAGEGESQGSYLHTGLSVNTTYYYSLFACDYARNYSVRATARATTLFQPANLLSQPGVDTFTATGSAAGWTPYACSSTGNVPPILFASDSAVYQTGGLSQKIGGFGSSTLPDSPGQYVHAGIMQTVAAAPGKVYLMVGYEALTAPSTGHYYFRTFGIDATGSTDPGTPGAANVAGARWLGPAALYWNSDPDGSNTGSGMYKCVSAVAASSPVISCWAGVGISLVAGRTASDKINYDSFYLHELDNPVNPSLANGSMEGAVFDCNDAGIHFPTSWVPVGGSYGSYAGYGVSAYSGSAHGGMKAAQFLCYPGRCDHGLMQRVVTYPGETLAASVWFRGVAANAPTTTAMIGIDPTGGVDVFSPTIVWTAYNVANSTTYALAAVTATALCSSATIFIRALSGSATGGYHTVYADDAAFTAAMSASRPVQLKSLPNGRAAALTGCVVTAVFGDCFYVEDTARTSGIRVVSPTSVQIGQKVTVSGTIGATDDERCIESATVTIL